VKIVADANIPLLAEAFSPVGEVVALPADRLTPQAVHDADALLVRSVTTVNETLLAGSRVRFVATATIGVDHIDQAYLAAQRIGFASATGSNARSVAEYVIAAMTVLGERGGYDFRSKVLGIIGCGNVGGRLARMAIGLGMKVLVNDPPLARQTHDPRYLPLEAMAEADIVTFHVPLTREGPDATYQMINARLLGMLKPAAVVFNTSRGGVADPAALAAARDSGRLAAMVLDVWQGEPNIDVAMVRRTAIATPHIAGYSYDGKVNGTRMVLEAFRKHFGIDRTWDPAPLMPPAANPEIELPDGLGIVPALRQVIRAAYDIEADDGRLRAIADQPAEARGRFFTDLRKNYPVRREFPATTVRMEPLDVELEQALGTLSFPVVELTPPGW
jgi:erythronate-4-phosphate dehydrogenase